MTERAQVRGRRRTTRIGGALVAVLSLAMPAGGGAGAEVGAAVAPTKPSCSTASRDGGNWRTYGGDLANTRSQPLEDTLTPAVAGTLAPAWKFSTGGAGTFHSTPTVVGSCLYIGSGRGEVYALDVDTGAVIWKTALPVLPRPGVGGALVGSLSVSGGRVFAIVNQQDAPYVAALDRKTGGVVWRSAPIDVFPGSYTNASPVFYNGLIVAGFSAAEGDSEGQGGVTLVDAGNGAIVKKIYTIPEADQALGYAGGGIWATAAVDEATGYAYVGTGNPFSKEIEHPNTNAIVKIDLDRGRPTFGQIVDSYKGNIDQYVPELEVLSDTPVCVETQDFFDGSPIDDPLCGQLDLDFGASPNLFVDAQGRTLVGELQKSGVYHVADTATMDRAWTAIMGLSCVVCNAASTAYDGTAIYGEGVPGGVFESLEKNAGGLRWATPVGDGIHYQPASIAAGVVYTTDSKGVLNGYDTATGVPVLARSLAVDADDFTNPLTSNGIAIASRTVFVAVAGDGPNGHVIAYRPS